MHQVMVCIGHNGAERPHRLDQDARFAILGSGGRIVAECSGQTASDEWGEEPGTWFAVQDVADVDLLRDNLARVAGKHGQEAIALVLGEVEMIEAREPVKRPVCL